MSTTAPTPTHQTIPNPNVDFDAIVIGAGFGGLRMLHELRQLGVSTRVIEAGTNVGGTWYWNRYPGARTDSESWVYAFSFSKELQDDWNWSEKYPSWSEALAYLQHVADRFDMRKDIQFETRVIAANYDEVAKVWRVTTDDGETQSCRYLISATGPLSTPYKPDFAGIDTFKGDWYLTGRWPKEEVDFTGKRVSIIGTGATAVQVIPLVAQTAAHLTVFQRTPNYVMPARNAPMTEFELKSIRANYDRIWELAREHVFGFALEPAGRNGADVSPEEAQRILERHWEIGGFRFLFETFDDILINEDTNKLVANFIRNKIRSIVKDPKTAELLCPTCHPVAGRRPPLGHFYYETFNRDNVSLVDVKDDPITEITERGIRTASEEYAADVIIFATGFDAVTGTLNAMNVRGRGGAALEQKWEGGPQTYLGITVDEFPNLFMVGGPQSPFANIPVVIDGCVDWIGRAIRHLRDNELTTMEANADAVAKWGVHMNDLVNATLMHQAKRSWFMGDNIPGKAHAVLFYFGGAGNYRKECLGAAERDFEGFTVG
ncbi:MAG: NAD(P)/FAD-dependent oxidoreductase [Proteobacteria bacterium]|nr:NAD(P)/FAD-dependent oxidoreductase [Pseudomonadota bacterium]